MKYTACFEAQVSIRDKPDAAEVKAPRVRRCARLSIFAAVNHLFPLQKALVLQAYSFEMRTARHPVATLSLFLQKISACIESLQCVFVWFCVPCRHVAVCRRAELGQTDASYKDFSLLVGGSDDFEWVYIKSLERVHTRNAKHGIVTLTLTNGSTVEVQCERGHAEATRFLSVLKCLKDQKPLVSLDNSSASKFCDECTECSQDGETGKENVNYAEHHTSAGIRTPTHSPDATGTDKKSAAYRHQRDPAATTTTDKVGDRGNKRKYSGSGASESGYTPRRKQQCKPDDAPATQTAATPHAHAEPMDAEHPQENEAATTAPAATRSKTTAPTQAETPRKRWKQHEEVDKVKAQRNDIDEQRKLLERERQEIQQKRETINAEREALNKAIKAKEDEQAKLEKLKKQVDQLGQQYEASVKEKNEEEERLNAATERLRAAKQAYEREEQQHRQQQQQNYQRERQQHAAAGTGGHASEKSAAECALTFPPCLIGFAKRVHDLVFMCVG